MPRDNFPLLAFDTRNFAVTEGASLRPGAIQKHACNPLFGEDFFADPPRRWEARCDNVYPSVFYDADESLFKCWYKAFIIDQASNTTELAKRAKTPYYGGKREEGLLYAVSEDGIHWEKPALGIIDFEGSRDNNLVMRRATHGLHAGGVFKDARDPDPARRYKFFHQNAGAGKMAACFSVDGLTWSQPVLWRENDAVGDTHNNALWASRLGKYIGITRGWRDGLRVVLRSESDDFLAWSAPREIMRGVDAHDQIYSMPIAAYAGLYIGLPAIFHKGRQSASDWDTVDTELAWSGDSRAWRRICPGQPLIPRGHGAYPDGEHDCGCVYAAAPFVHADRIMIYYGGSNGRHNDWREGSLNLATLAIDRWAGLAAETGRRATIVTSDLRLTADTLRINADVAAGGGIRAGIIDGGGSTLPGFGAEDCAPISHGGSGRQLRWKKPLSAIAGNSLRLALELNDAALYAIYGAAPVR